MPRSTAVRALAALAATLSCTEGAPELDTGGSALQTPLPSASVGSLPGNFAVDAAGQATYAVPLELGPGLNGVEPDLRLVYASRSGNGTLGVGFSLTGWTVIARCPKTLADDGAGDGVHFATTDAFCLDGDRLVLASGTYAQHGSTYRPRRDPRTKVELVGSTDTLSSYWRVYRADGRVRTLGLGVANQRDHGGVPYEWWIGTEEDRYGNAIDYTYQQVVETGDTVEMYPTELRYTRYAGAWVHKVELSYDPAIGPVLTGWFYGARRRIGQRVWRVESRSAANAVHAGYLFTYETGGAGDAALGPRLTTVHRYDGAGVHQAPTVFTWERGASALEAYQPPQALPDLDDYQVVLPGDFDGDGRDELLVSRHPMGDLEGPITDASRWAFVDLTSGTYRELDRYAYYTHEVDSHFVIDFNGDGLDDVLVLKRESPNGTPEVTPGGEVFEVFLGHVDQLAGPIRIDDDSAARISKVIPLDEDGDGLTDLWMCRGGWWVFGRNLASATHDPGFGFTQTSVDCHFGFAEVVADGDGDEVQVMALDGDGRQTLLYVPSHDGDQLLLDSQRVAYLRLDFDAATGTAALHPSGLPRDLFQRYHADCGSDDHRPGPAAEGLGDDLLVDLDGDGFTDVLRAELLGGDTHADLDEILRPFWLPPTQAHSGCKTAAEDSDDHMMLVRPYFNTGAGFVPGDAITTMVGNAHLNYRHDFLPWQLLDADGDGTADLVHRDVGFDPDGDAWRFFRNDGTGHFTRGSYDVAHWPGGYDGTDQEPVDEVEEAVLYTTDVDGDGLHDLIMRRQRSATLAPAALRIYKHSGQAGAANLLIGITNGLGERTRIAYRPSTDAGVHTPYLQPMQPARPLGGVLWLVSHVDRDAGLGDGVWRTTDYHYTGGAVSSEGRGFLGFRAIELREGTTTATTRDADLAIERQEFDQAYDATVADHPYAGRPQAVTRQVRLSGEPIARYRVTRTELTPTLVRTDLPFGRTSFVPVDRVAETRLYLIAQADCGVGDPCTRPELDASGWLRSWERTTRTFDPLASIQTELRERSTGDHTRITRGPIVNDTGAWLLGQVASEQTDECTADGACRSRAAAMTYVPGKGVLATLTDDPTTPLAARTTFGYDARGNVTSIAVKDLATSVTRTTTLAYDPTLTTLVTRTDPLGHVTTFEIDPVTGQTGSEQDPNGFTVRSQYDGLGRLLRTSHHATALGPSDGADVTLTYAASSPTPATAVRISQGQQGGGQIAIDHDRLGREIRRTWRERDGSAAGKDAYQTTEYDARGRVTRVSLPTFVDDATPDGYTTTTYDDGGRPLVVTYPDRSTERWSYDGMQVEHTDRDGKRDQVWLDGFERVGTTLDATGVQTCVTYGWFGMIRSVQRDCAPVPHGLQPITRYDVDGHGRPLSESSLEGGLHQISYSPFGEPIRISDANGVVHSLTRDKLGRVTLDAVTVGGVGAGNATYTYDTVKIGALTSATSLDGVTTTYGYDGFLRETSRSTTVPGVAGAFGFTRTYDGNARLATLTYPTPPGGAPAIAVVHGYDAAGHLRSLTRASAYLWRADGGTAAGQVTAERFGDDDSLVGARGYDPLTFRPTSITLAKNGTFLQRDSYGWTADGDLARRRDVLRDQLEELGYTDLHQLASERITAGVAAPVTLTTTYDALGNRASRTGFLGAYGYDAKNRLASVGSTTLTYDPAGNQLRRGSITLTYTPFDQVKTITAGPVTAYSYDADLRRVRKYTAATAREVLSFDDRYERTTESGVATHAYHVFADGRVVAKLELRKPAAAWQLTTRFVQTDHLGSPVVVTDLGGVPVEPPARYDAWGGRRDPADWRLTVAGEAPGALDLGFTGHRRELDAGFIDMRGRLQDPVYGRMTGVDPVVADRTRALFHDRYSYVRNNPLRYTDPSGYEGESAPLPGDHGCEPIQRTIIVETSPFGLGDPTSVNPLGQGGVELATMAVRASYQGPAAVVKGVLSGYATGVRYIGALPWGSVPPAGTDDEVGDTDGTVDDPGAYLEEEDAAEDDGLSKESTMSKIIGATTSLMKTGGAVGGLVVVSASPVGAVTAAAGAVGGGALVNEIAEATGVEAELARLDPFGNSAENWREGAHGNSYMSPITQYLYEIVDPIGETFKYGTTADASPDLHSRYPGGVEQHFGQGYTAEILKSGDTRWIHWVERTLLKMFEDLNGRLPPGNKIHR